LTREDIIFAKRVAQIVFQEQLIQEKQPVIKF